MLDAPITSLRSGDPWSALAGLALRRQSVVLGVWGDPGVGKSFTVQAWRQALTFRSASVVAGAPITSVLRSIPRPARLPVWLERRLEDLERGETEDAAAADALAALLVAVAPFVLHVEDLSTASPARLEWWGLVAASVARSKGVGLIASGRGEPPAVFGSVHLRPLDEAGSNSLLEREVGGVLPKAALAWVWRRAQGNPLYTLEHLRFLLRQGFLWSDGQRWRWRAPTDARLPTSLEGFLARVIQLAITDRTVGAALEARAMLPDEVPMALWARCAGLDALTLESARAELERHGVLRGTGFSHPLYREAVLTGLRQEAKRLLARQTLEVLVGHAHTDALEAAGFDRWGAAASLIPLAEAEATVALDVLLGAAEQARAMGDGVQAGRLLGQASHHAMGAERARLAREAAGLLRLADPAEALRFGQVADRERPDEDTTLFCAELLVLEGELDQAQALVQNLPSERLEGVWLPRLIGLQVQRTDFAGVIRLWREHPEIHEIAPPLTRRDVAWALMQFGEFSEANRLLEGAFKTAPTPRERGLLLAATGYLRLLEGQLEQAVSLHSQAITTLEREGSPRDLARACELRAEVLEHLGRSREAASDGERAVALRGELGDGWGVARAQLRLAAALLDLGEYERAEELLLEGRELPERSGAHDALIVWDCQLAHLYSEWNPPHGPALALRHASAALALARAGTSPVLLNTALAQAAWVEAWHGDPAHALHLADEALGLARTLGQADQAALETLARGAALERLGDLETATLEYTQAIEQLRQGGVASHERYALELDRLRGDASSASQRLSGFLQRDGVHAANLTRRYFPNLEAVAVVASRLELQVLGPLQAVVNGQPVRVQTATGKRLLALLMEAKLDGRPELTDLELADALHPDQPEDRARSAIKNLVYRLRHSLGADAILRTTTGYTLGNAMTDAQRFLEAGDLALWRGPYLDGLDLPESHLRTRLHQRLLEATHAMLERDPKTSVRAARILVATEPYDLDALEVLCEALRKTNNRRDLAREYTAGRERLLEVGEHLPESWQVFLGV